MAAGNRTRPLIAIDGPVGAGKSTVARKLASEIGFTYLNTGAMYRAVAIAARNAGLAPNSPDLAQRLSLLLGPISIRFDGEKLLLNGDDVSDELRNPLISDLASQFSTIAEVRTRLRELQRAAGAEGGVVMEGRDIATAVFPDAEFKFYLDADARVRARRRYLELKSQGVEIEFDDVFKQLIERDRRDSGREIAPLMRAAEAIVIDCSNLTIEQVVDQIKSQIQRSD